MLVTCKQIKPLTVKIVGAFLLILTIWMVLEYNPPLSQVFIMALLAFILLGYEVCFQFYKNYENKRILKIFGVVIWSSSLKVIFPDYIKVYSGIYKQQSEFGPVSALGKGKENTMYAVRFFKGTKHFTPFKSANLNAVEYKAKELATLLKVELLDN